MARAATTSDVFNAIAEPQRRQILVLLRAGERPVTELAQALRMTQPGASKHLRVLREVQDRQNRRAARCEVRMDSVPIIEVGGDQTILRMGQPIREGERRLGTHIRHTVLIKDEGLADLSAGAGASRPTPTTATKTDDCQMYAPRVILGYRTRHDRR
jgi:hypothetical protein